MSCLIGAKTHFSVGESIITPAQLIEEVVARGHKALVVSDSNNINALPMLSAKAKEAGLKYVIGAGYTVVEPEHLAANWGDKGKRPRVSHYMPSLYPLNEQGLHEAMSLLTLANDPDHFYDRPQIELSELCRAVASGNVAVSTGSAFSLFAHTDYASQIERLASALVASKIVLEVQPIRTPYFDKVNALTLNWWKANQDRATLVLSRPALHRRGDENLRMTMSCILGRAKYSDSSSMGWIQQPTDGLHVLTWDEMKREYVDTLKRLASQGRIDTADIRLFAQAAVAGTQEFADSISYEWSKMPVSLPQMAPDPFKELYTQVVNGFRKRIQEEVLGYKPPVELHEVYIKRLQDELRIINRMGFCNYFLLVSKLVNWCRTEGIMVGPGRGSVGGSLIAFLLEITDVDPIRFNLIFERFINPDRLDLPDIDLDFMSSRREEVIEYLVSEFGRENVAGISNYSELGPSSALRSVASVHGLKENQFDCSKLVPKEQGQPIALEEAVKIVPELERFASDYPVIWQEATNLQSTLRGYARHAAGVIVAGEPIRNRAVIEERSGATVVNWDKQVVEDFGLVKLDILGLSTLDILDKAKRRVRERKGVEVDLHAVALDDPKVLAAFADGDTRGVFQFESAGMRNLLRDLAKGGELEFNDLVAATALYRPGPMQSGLMDRYVDIKRGVESPSYAHPKMRDALTETKSVMIFQEQVMQLARDLAGFTMAESDKLRKIMGKKLPEEMKKVRDKWVEGCVAHSGMDEHTAGELFDQVDKFAGYGFNKSHSVEYSVISFWSMWFKVYHTAEFFAAAMSVLSEDKMMGMVKNARAYGITVLPPDVNISTNEFEIREVDGSTVLYAPLSAIKGLSERGASEILEARKSGPFKDQKDFEARVNRRVVNVRVRDTLDKVGAFAGFAGQKPALDPERLKDQKALLPDLILNEIGIERTIERTKESSDRILLIASDAKKCCDDHRLLDEGDADRCPYAPNDHVWPFYGKRAKIMVVTDYPTRGEVKSGKMAHGDGSEIMLDAMKKIGLSRDDAYFTSLVKANKSSKELVPNKVILSCSTFLEREIEALQPSVILVMGTMTARKLVPEIKGSWEENVCDTYYDSTLKATIVMGLNPQILFFKADKAWAIDAVFNKVAEILDA